MSPTQRSLKFWRGNFWTVAIVEHWNPFAKVRQDLFGMFDLLAFAGNTVVGIQCTTGTNHAARVAKLRANPTLDEWRKSPHRQAVVQSWRKIGGRWQERTEYL